MKQSLVFLICVLSFLGYSEAGLPYPHISSNQNHRGFLTKRKAKVIPNAPDGLDASKYNPDLTSNCNVPSISKTISVSTPTTVAAGETFDCQFAKYQHTDTSCNLDSERGNTDAVFLLEEGATLKNCILGYSQESVHCKGSCTVENSHWIEICDDAINFQMKSGEATVSGCSFANAGNKALQFNGGGTLNVENSCFSNVDIGYRSCGNCKTTTARAAVFKNIELKGVKVLAGYNHANGDTVDIQSYSGTPAQHMCEAKDAGTGKEEVPPGCTISGAGSSSNSSTSSSAGSSNSSSETTSPSTSTGGGSGLSSSSGGSGSTSESSSDGSSAGSSSSSGGSTPASASSGVGSSSGSSSSSGGSTPASASSGVGSSSGSSSSRGDSSSTDEESSTSPKTKSSSTKKKSSSSKKKSSSSEESTSSKNDDDKSSESKDDDDKTSESKDDDHESSESKDDDKKSSSSKRSSKHKKKSD